MTTETEIADYLLPVKKTIFEIEILGSVPTEHIPFFKELFANVIKRETDAIFLQPPKVIYAGER